MTIKKRKMPFSQQQLLRGNFKDLSQVYKKPLVKLPTMPNRYRMPSLSGEYWYIVAKLNGRMVLLGPYDNESAAYEVGSSKLNTSYAVIPLQTRSRAAATQQMRHRMLNETSDLALSLKRMRHRI